MTNRTAKQAKREFNIRMMEVVREFEDELGQKGLALELMRTACAVLVWDESMPYREAYETLNKAAEALVEAEGA